MKEETKQMGLMKKLTSALVASSLVFSLVGTAAAAYTPAAGETGAKRMQSLNLITGRDGGDLALNSEITRAELVTIIVRAFGKEADAKLLTGSTVFPDTANHWASGNIAMAVALANKAGSDPIGMPDGTFAPDAKLTPAQAVAFLMKFVGVKADASKSWPANYLDVAVEKNLISAEDKAIIAPMLNENATRGLVFYLFDRAFFGYKLPTGGTFYTTYVDNKAPELTVNAVDATTMDSKVTITGNVKDAAELYVGTTKVTADASGNFSADVALDEIKAYDITVTALDIAGNKAEKSVKVTRAIGTVAKIEATDITVTAGGTVEVKAVAKDAKGNVVADAAITGESTVGTYADGVFTAGKTVGSGTLTLKAGEVTADVKVTINAGALATVTADKASAAPGEKVTLTAKDANGNVLTGVTYTQTSADALVDSTNGTFIASKAGSYTVTAKAGDVTKDVVIGVYSTTVAKYKVTASADNVIANNSSTVTLKVQAVDANGNLVASDTSSTTLTSASFEAVDEDGNVLGNLSSYGVTLKNGVASVIVETLASEFGGKIAQVYTGTAGATNSTTASVTLVDQVATSIAVSNSDVFLPSNATNRSTTFTVKVLDQAGEAMLRGYFPVDVALTGSGAVINGGLTTTTAKLYISSGAGATVVLNPSFVGAAGTATVTASATGLNSGSDSVTVQMPGPAAKLAISASSSNPETPKANHQEAVQYTVKVTDAAGVPLNDVSPTTIKVNFPDLTSSNRGQIRVATTGAAALTAGGLSANTVTVTVTNGVGTFGIAAEKYTGALNFQVIDDRTSGAYTATDMKTVTFKADAPAAVAFTVNGIANKGTANVSSASPELTIVGQLYDAAGNKTTGTDAKINLVGAGSNGGVDGDVVINGVDNNESVAVDANGSATFNVKVGNYVGAQYTLTAKGIHTVNGTATDVTGVLSNMVKATTLTVTNSIATNVAIGLYSDAGYSIPLSTVNAGDNIYVKATVTDNAGRKLSGETVKLYKQNSDGTWTEVGAMSAGSSAGTYVYTTQPTSAPSMTYKVEAQTSAPAVSSQFSVGVRPSATPAKLVMTGGTNSGAAQDLVKGTVTAYTINVADTYGNTVVNNTNADITVSLAFAGIPSGKLVQVRTAADGLAVSSQSGTSATASVTIPAGAQGVTFYVVTDASASSTFTMAATAGGLTGTGTVTFTVK